MATASGRLIVWLKRWLKRWKMLLFVVLFICAATILVKGWRSSEQELAKYFGDLIDISLRYLIDSGLGYLIGGVLLIWQISVAGRRATAAEKTAELTEKGNIAERFKNAIEHLGNDSASVRLGGVYALHHIAQEVEDYQKRVFEILCAHIRETTTHTKYKPRNADSEEIQPTIEIQSILNLLFIETQGKEIYKGLQCNLEGADLRGANLSNSNLLDANLCGASLQNAFLIDANLQNADLFHANLREANLQYASLRHANLQNADLGYAELQRADFGYARLKKADLREANLRQAKLQNADLREANLQNAKLQRANLQYASLWHANLQEDDLRYTKNLKIALLLKAKTLYKAKLPDGMEEKIKEIKPELFEPPKPKQES